MAKINKGRNSEMREKFASGVTREELKEFYNMTGKQVGAIIGYVTMPKKEVEIQLTPYLERDNEIIRTFSQRNTKGALSMSHIEVKPLVNTRMKI